MAFSSTTASAPGKVILHGEHSVVYGKLALAASVNLRTTVTLTSVEGTTVSLDLVDLGLKRCWSLEALQAYVATRAAQADPAPPDDAAVAALLAIPTVAEECSGTAETGSTVELALVAFLHLYLSIGCRAGTLPSIEASVVSALPIGAGLGSSAAYGVSLAGGLLFATAKVAKDQSGALPQSDLDLVNKWAFVSEQIIHGTPSGIDNSIATTGGALTFIKGQTPVQLEAMPSLRVLLVNTRVSRSTKAYVAGVRKKLETFPAPMGQILDSMDSISKDVGGLLADLKGAQDSGNAASLDSATAKIEGLIELNQHLLNAIGVGHPALDKVCGTTKKFGLAAKLTGAGGGGCAFALVPPNFDQATMESVVSELGSFGFDVFETTVGGEGLSLSEAPKKTAQTPAATPVQAPAAEVVVLSRPSTGQPDWWG